MIDIKRCPTCGSDRIHKARRTVTRGPAHRRYTVPKLAFYECPNCGEQVFDPGAMEKIETHRTAAAKAVET